MAGSQSTFIPWIPYGIHDGFHGFHMDSIRNNPGKVKTSRKSRWTLRVARAWSGAPGKFENCTDLSMHLNRMVNSIGTDVQVICRVLLEYLYVSHDHSTFAHVLVVPLAVAVG